MAVELAAWVEAHSDRLRAARLQPRLQFQTEGAKPGAWLQLTGAARLADVLVWTTGECEVHVAAVDDGVVTTSQRSVPDEAALDAVMEEVLSQLI